MTNKNKIKWSGWSNEEKPFKAKKQKPKKKAVR